MTMRICPHGHGAGAQQVHPVAIARQDGRLEADLRFPAVEHDAHRLAELLAHVLRARGTQTTVAIGRRRSDAAAERGQQLLCHRM